MSTGTSVEPKTFPDSERSLQEQLDLANERLQFYEGFDALIADNVRRSGDLMREAISSREEASRASSAVDASQVKATIDTLRAELLEIAQRVEVATERLATLQALVHLEPAGAKPTAVPPKTDSADPELPARVSASKASPVKSESAWSTPQSITVIAHGVPSASNALALQRHLATVDAVSRVDTREFAEGVLRLQVESSRPLTAADFEGWSAGKATIRSLETGLVDLAL